ncbi:MAG: DNA gyrase C-terminal beta-propeller domain-containing protein, partial [Pseudomonadota bacterium]
MPAFAQNSQVITVAPEAEQFVLANGLQVVVIPDHRAPVVTHMVWYRIGAADEVPGVSGIAHFLEHLMFKGTASLKPGEFSKKIRALVKTELMAIREKYADERRTKVIKGGAKVLSVEDLIPDEENAVVLTAGGYIKRTNPDEYKRQKRGGVGVVDLDTKEEDFVTNFLTASTHSDLLFFTDKGKSYQIK